MVTVVAQLAKAPGIHNYVAGSIPAVTPRYCTKKIEKCSLEHKKREKKIKKTLILTICQVRRYGRHILLMGGGGRTMRNVIFSLFREMMLYRCFTKHVSRTRAISRNRETSETTPLVHKTAKRVSGNISRKYFVKNPTYSDICPWTRSPATQHESKALTLARPPTRQCLFLSIVWRPMTFDDTRWDGPDWQCIDNGSQTGNQKFFS
jgi:hypothetical protein